MAESMALENGVLKLDIGTFVLCYRRLCLLIQPFRKGYEIFFYVTRWQSPRLTLFVMMFAIYLSIWHPVYLVHIPLIYAMVMLSLSGVRKSGLKNSKGSVLFRRKKVKKKEDDISFELKLAAMKQAHEDLNEYINISVQIQMLEEILCEYLETFYRIYRWENTAFSKICLLALLFPSCILFLFPGRYLVTVGVIGVFLGNSGFNKVCRHAATQYQLNQQQWKKNMFSQKYWKSALVNAWTTSSFKAQIAMETTENDYDDEWYDAEQETLSECESYEDEYEVEEDEDTPTRKRRARLFSGLSVVSNFSDYRRKQRRLNCGNCASCDVSFSSVLKKRVSKLSDC
ncbi:hypothetical protein ACROYT_G005352 [Oculina patagonica]